MSLATLAAPATLPEAVIAAVGNGAWSPCEIVLAVADQHAHRSDVMATLWELVDAGTLAFRTDGAYPAFWLARP